MQVCSSAVGNNKMRGKLKMGEKEVGGETWWRKNKPSLCPGQCGRRRTKKKGQERAKPWCGPSKTREAKAATTSPSHWWSLSGRASPVAPSPRGAVHSCLWHALS
ncbi:hypothetical protein N7468_004552 [Penicillium chermesinum]|uniref:Uncharacterized protein n=1 Tax=Penicillium chermesinum TaxID=63820 RepID=A0A9W9TTB3_9EURO|nr:uncharacterized protein N7468_004552 [Penicillium chermesinum]KAJ5239933.1 hypothetical protein N7468_004552 [Penicillium chermesinum]